MKMMNRIILATTCLLLMSGCGTVGGILKKQPVVNFVTTTNASGSTVQTAETNFIYEVSPAVQNTIAGADQLAAFAPAPYGPLATGALSLLSGALGILAAWKSRQLSASQKIAAIVQPLIAGIEAANSPAVKTAIQTHAVAAGVQGVLDPLVQAVVQQMPSPPK